MRCQANAITIGYDRTGKGEPVTLIHALGADRTMWWQQVDALSPRYSVMAYDVRGHGESGKPPGPYSLDLFAADLGALLEALRIPRSHLVGISMGGMIAQAFALKHPERVGSLVLVDTSAEQDAASRTGLLDRAATVEAQGMAPVVEPTLERWFTAPFHQARPEIVERIRRVLLAIDPHGYAEAARAIAPLDFAARLPEIRCPTLVVVGEHDPSTPPQDALRLQRGILGAQLLVIPDAAHLSPVEQAGVFNEAVEEFLSAKEQE